MKTNNSINGRGMKSILACLVAMVMGLSLASCSSIEDNPVPAEPQTLAEQLTDTNWFAEYDETGTVTADGVFTTGKVTFQYSHVADYYSFSDKAGSVYRFYFGEDKSVPIGRQFVRTTYTSTQETPKVEGKTLGTGDVEVMISGTRWWDEFPQGSTLKMRYDNGKLSGEGINGHPITMEPPTEKMAEALLIWRGSEPDASGIDDLIDISYVDAYKPSVDHSKWMAPLADNRMVADLSLPGTHDACTAEGWHLAQLISESTAKTQDLTIDEQLKVGVRVFDLRPERVYNAATMGYDLRCCHGVIQTELLVKDFFLKMRDFLKENPTEFCIVTSSVNATLDKNAWAEQFSALINGSDLSGLFADFKPNITVGDLRGRVLLLSRDDCEGMTAGGFLGGWSSNKLFDRQQNGTIRGVNGLQTPLWTQDYYDVGSDLTGKDEAIRRMLDATAERDMTSASPAWVFNYSAGYVGLVSSDHYRENAARTNRLVIDYLNNPLHNASAGIVMMDYAGMDKTPGYNSSTVYESCGLQLVEALIDQNFRTPGTIDASLFSVCTLNVDGLPDIYNDDGPSSKFTPVISRYLADKAFDFIGVQENFNFDPELGRHLIANYDHDNWAGGMTLGNLFNDHVHVAVFHTDGCKAWWRSHLTVVRTDSIRWNDRYGYADHCLDEAATKGFRRYEITTTDGYQLVVYNMHMEASERWDEVGGTDDEDRACRLKQWIQLREHIFSKLDTRPVLVIGDFNTYYCRDDMKANFIDAINASGRATCGDAWIEKCRDGVYPKLEDDKKIKDDGDYLGWTIRGEMPDKILYINPTGGHSVELLSCTYDNAQNSRDYFKPSGYAKDHEEPLGDHFPLFATFRLK